MIIRTVYFTERGRETAETLFANLSKRQEQVEGTASAVSADGDKLGWPENAGPNDNGDKDAHADSTYRPEYREKEQDLTEWTKDGMRQRLPILFVGACGIAVRHIAPFVADKMTDSPILVMDEAGTFVIPVLSGHLGGANKLARIFAEAIDAQPVITTATDVNGLFSIDVFAAKNGLSIRRREGIREVSGALLAGRKLTYSIDRERIEVEEGFCLPEQFTEIPYPPQEKVDVLITDDPADQAACIVLVPRHLIIGMGCRRGVPFEDLQAFLLQVMEDYGKSESDIEQELFAVASIDKKADERGLQVLAQYHHVPFLTYSAEELEAVEGEFASSAFVQSKVGVANVCERSSLLACGSNGELIIRKLTHNGMTLAAALKKGCIRI